MVKTLVMYFILLSASAFCQEENTVLIEINNCVKFRWSNDDFCIVKDNLFYETKEKINDLELCLLDGICDRKKTPALMCGMNYRRNNKKRNLKKGDLAFLMLDEIYNIPYYKVFDVELDSYDGLCKYPDFLIYVLDKNRGCFKNKLEMYLKMSQME